MSENKLVISQREKNKLRKRKLSDLLANGTTILFSTFCVAILVWILVYVFSNGYKYLTWEYLTSDYSQDSLVIKTPDDFDIDNYQTFDEASSEEGTYFSSKWGVSLKNGVDNDKNTVVYFANIQNGSPIKDLINAGNTQVADINQNYYISYINFESKDGLSSTIINGADGAQEMAKAFDKYDVIFTSVIVSLGGGIRGSLLNTLLLIIVTIIIALPIGIGAAIYLACYAKEGRLTRVFRTLIDITSGIPSIIFGLAGAIIFIPFTNVIMGTNGGNILSGALTMSIMLLPTIVKNTEESIKVIPKPLKDASLALGASYSQTMFKVILPNALPRILTSVLLSIGRIIGESAALVFALGTTIGDTASFTKGYATLAVHIWLILGGETPAYGSACAISIIIILTVLILSILVKLISLRLNKFKGRN
jgi:phosphate transport system permease protein